MDNKTIEILIEHIVLSKLNQKHQLNKTSKLNIHKPNIQNNLFNNKNNLFNNILENICNLDNIYLEYNQYNIYNE